MDIPGQQALALARQAVEHYVWGWGLLPPPPESPPLLNEPGAAFVTLRLGQALRGCIGTLGPTKPTLADEIITNAVAAASSDPRFPPVQAKELAVLLYEVGTPGGRGDPQGPRVPRAIPPAPRPRPARASRRRARLVSSRLTHPPRPPPRH